MNNTGINNDIIIIGAGFAGLGAGIYGQMNGYRTQIFEMHDKPGGLCTSWQRKGYTFDCCIHWLVGSNPESAFHTIWEETGISEGRKFINMDEYMRFEGADGRTLIFYSDVDRLEKHLLEFSPGDADVIKEFISGIRMCIPFDQYSKKVPFLKRTCRTLKMGFTFTLNGSKFRQWMKTTAEEFAGRFKDPLLREAFREIWIPEFSMLFMLFTFAYLHNRDAGYPLGGSTPMSETLAARYIKLGGKIDYSSRVKKIIVENDIARGVILDDGTEHYATRVISAADGYNTIFNMLEGRYADEKVREPYDKWAIFKPLIFVSFGVNRSFANEPLTVSGFSYPLKNPEEIGDSVRNRIGVHIYNHDPAMAPEGKTVVTVMLPSEHEYWKKLAVDRQKYLEKKKEIADKILFHLDQRFPGFASQVEVTDVATPLTFERYTGNWQGSFEGWLITPENSYTVMKPLSQKLPGLENFYMCGQWVEPGGGLPTGIMSGKRVLKQICKEDGKKIKTSIT